MKPWISMLGLSFALALNVNAEEARPPQTPVEKIGYALGADMARNFKKYGIEIDVEMAAQGMRDASAGKSQLSDEEVRKILSGFQGEVRRKMSASRQSAAVDNRAKGEAFLTENKTKPGVQVLAGGVQYRIVKEGKGAKPTLTDAVLVRYKGTLLDGTVFDRTEGEAPARLAVGGLIAGWREVLQYMPVGSSWQVWIPAAKAYGVRGSGNVIGPEETLVFDIDLVDIAK